MNSMPCSSAKRMFSFLRISYSLTGWIFGL
ncbi:Uncharacterised protein [Bordetella pertussis]|nr:Uncharacterised protein [Bordetella pertussis]